MESASQTLVEIQRAAHVSPSLLMTTKFTIPAARPRMVPRIRLTDRLNRDAAYRLVLVVAPAGWGKTSLVGQWVAEQTNLPVSIAWVSLDPSDNDLTRFLLYLTAAIGTAYPELGKAVCSLVLSAQPAAPEVILTVLLNEISTLDRSFVIVLDDYHVIAASPVHDAVNFLLDHLPPSLRVIVTTRSDPPFPLARMRARGQLLEIRAHDLRFTTDESVQFLNRVMGLNLDAAAAARLEARTEGWIAGLQLAALWLQERADPSEFIDSFTGSNRYVMDYLFDEVMARQPVEVQSFLIETSILDRLCGPLCEAVLRRSGGQSLLEKLEAHNLFLIPLNTDRHWYRYHHLFADALRVRLIQQGEKRIAELHGRAAAWYEQQEMVEEAIYHALEGRHWEDASRLIEQYSDAMLMQGGQSTLEHWLKALPAEWIEARPTLSFFQATMHLFYHDISAALAALDNCKATEPSSWTPELRGRVAILRSNIVRFQGDLDAAVSLARAGLAFLPNPEDLWHVSAHYSLAIALYEGYHLPEAEEILKKVILEARHVGNTHTCMLAYITYGQLREAQGALYEADRTYREALAYAVERKYDHAGEMAGLFAGMVRIFYQRNDLAAAETYVQEGLKRKHTVYPLSCYVELLRIRKARHDPEGIATVLRDLEAAAQQTHLPWLPPTVAALMVQLGYADAAETALWADTCEAHLANAPSLPMPDGMGVLEAITWARVRFAEGRTETARSHLNRLLDTLTRQGRHGDAMELAALLAMMHFAARMPDSAIKILEPALRLAAKESYVRVFLEGGRELVPVLRECAARGIEPEYVAGLLGSLRSDGVLQSSLHNQAVALADPLTEREIEVLRLVAAGLSNPEIAEHLYLSVGTVKRHVHNILVKLDAASRLDAVSRANELDLLS